MKYKQNKQSRFRGLAEWHRTVVLFALLFTGLGVMYWTNNNVSNNFVDQFSDDPISANVTDTEDGDDADPLRQLVQQRFVANGRIDGFDDRFNNLTFIVNSNGEQDYSVLELPDEGDATDYIVFEDTLFVGQNDVWDEPQVLTEGVSGFAATRFTPTNEEANIAFESTTQTQEAVVCAVGECTQWEGTDDQDTEFTIQLGPNEELVRLASVASNGVEVTIDFAYNTEPQVRPWPRGL